MKTIKFTLILQILTFASVFSQTSINAEEIIDKINKNETVSYKNVTIIGDLNLYLLDNMKLEWSGKNKKYKSLVETPVEFYNCVFKNKVLFCKWEEKTKTSHVANFKNKAIFQNCIFEGEADFQHSKFNEYSDFSGSVFQDESDFQHSGFQAEADFQHTDFSSGVDFSSCEFGNEVDFQHTNFDGLALFKGSVFKGEADFQHTSFLDGSDFSNVLFIREVDMEYTKFYDPVNFSGMKFQSEADIDKAKVNGQLFVNYLLQNK